MGVLKSILMLTAILLTFTIAANAEARPVKTCKYQLQNERRMVLDIFKGYGYSKSEACSEARFDCRRAIRAGYYRTRRLSCVQVQPNRRNIVHRSCVAKMVTPRGRRIHRTFIGQASGRRGSQVKQRACMNALRKCQRAVNNSGRYRARCIAENGRGGIGDIIPLPPVRPHRPGRLVRL